MQKTKHDIVIEFIESLDVGEKVSVRQLARQMNISEGTVYRAIKDAENEGLVSSIPKVGTIRIEQEKERSIDSLTYRELANIVEGQLLHGADKSDVAPKAFFVASSEAHLREKKPLPQTMIIGEYSKELMDYVYSHDLPVMLTGDSGIAAKNRLEALSDKIVVISTPYDIFDAIIAINHEIDISDLERVRGYDVMKIMRIGRDFISGKSEEPYTPDSSDAQSETTPEPSTRRRETSESEG